MTGGFNFEISMFCGDHAKQQQHGLTLSLFQDRIAEITNGRNSKALDNKVLEIVKRVKSIEVIKTSLDKLAEESSRTDDVNVNNDVNAKNDANVNNDVNAKNDMPNVNNDVTAKHDVDVKNHSKSSKLPASTKSSVASLKGFGGPSGVANKYTTKVIEFLEMIKNHPEKVDPANANNT